MKYFALRSFTKKFDSYPKHEQELVVLTIEKIKDYMETNQAPYGLRVKKLSAHLYEVRINIHLRIAYFRENDVVKLFCLGNHDDISRCLKSIKRDRF